LVWIKPVRALQMEAEDAAIVDIGGESTRSGAAPVAMDDEIGRVVPVIEALQSQFKVPISVVTQQAPNRGDAGGDSGGRRINNIFQCIT